MGATLQMNSQTIKLKDYTTHLAVQYANIQNITTQVFYISDDNGQVNISNYKAGDTLLVTHINYHPLYIYPEDINRTDIFYLFPTPYSGPQVDIIGRQESKNELPSQIEIIKADAITYKNSQTAADLLQSSGNILIQKSQLGGGSPIIRGFEANKVLLVLDGVRLNNAIYRSGHLQNAITIDNNVLKDVEIIFGPGSVMYGSDALGGVIYYKTRDPLLSGEKSNQIASASIMQRLSSASQEKTFHFDFSVGFEKWGFLTSFSQADFGDLKMGTRRPHGNPTWGLVEEYVTRINEKDTVIKNADPRIQKHSGYKQWDFLQKILYRPSDHVKFSLNLNFSTSTNVPRFDKYTEYKNNHLKWAKWDYGPQNRLLFSLTTSITKSNQWFDAMQIITSSQLIEEDRITRKFGSSKQTTREEDVTVHALNIDLKKAFTDKTKIYYGSEVTLNSVNSKAKKVDINTSETTEAITRYPNGGSTMNNGAIYFGLNQKLGRTNLKSGIRYSYTQITANFKENPFFRLPYESIRFNNGALTGSLGINIPLDSTWQLKVGIASGYRSPNVDDLGKIREKNGFVTVPNDQLKPEYAYNNEINIQKSNKTKDIIGSITGYYTYINNIIVQRDWLLNNKDYLVIEGDTARVITNKNANNAFISGLNFQFKAKFSDRFSMNINYNFTYGLDTSDSIPLSHIPPVFGLAEITYKVEKFSATINTLFNGKKDISKYGTGTTDNPQQALPEGTPSWWTLNWYSSYYVSPIVKVQFSIENILDMHYKPFASGISAPGRNFILSLRANF